MMLRGAVTHWLVALRVPINRDSLPIEAARPEAFWSITFMTTGKMGGMVGMVPFVSSLLGTSTNKTECIE